VKDQGLESLINLSNIVPDVQNDNTYDLNDREEYSNFNSEAENSGFLDLTNNDGGGLFGFGNPAATAAKFWATGGGIKYEPGIL
jgi:hypothetical protein